MAGRRSYSSYNDGCAAAHALDIIGERWALIVVRELLLGPKRFADLQRDIVGIGPPVLSQRLRDLEAAGVLARRPLPPPAAGQAYHLTPWGRELESVNAALSRWAVASPRMPFDADMSPDTLVLAMRAHARPLPQLPEPFRVQLQLIDSRIPGSLPVSYLATVGPSATEIIRTPEPGPVDAEALTTTRTWKACVIAGGALRDSPGVQVSGDHAAVEAVLVATRL